MDDIKLSVDQSKTGSYSKVSTEEDTELYDFDIEKEQPVTNSNYLPKNKKSKINKRKSFCYKKIGNTYCYFGDKWGNPKIIIGPHWPMYFCFCPFMSFCFFMIFYSIWDYLHIILQMIGLSVFLLFFISYTYLFLANPGMPVINENSYEGKPRNKYKFCNECKIWVSNKKTTEHCFDCNVCVEGYDHHCPWTGKCIGKRNIIFFYIFITTVLFSIVFFIFSLAFAANKYDQQKRKI